jgi:uncharacterized membrane protein YgcG
MIKKLLAFLGLVLFMIVPFSVSARQPFEITNWYIKVFRTEIVVNTDSSLLITETIVADCGDLLDKHGIYQVLPEFYVMDAGEKISTPIELISIKDENGKSRNYSTIKDRFDRTITWKIGDADRTVRGENTYVIKYRVLNTIRFGNDNFDEFYWNLNGNFWDLETDNFIADVVFPAGITRSNSETFLYSGGMGDKDAGLAEYRWVDDSTIRVNSQKMFKPGEGVTLSVTFPKGIIFEPELTFWQEYKHQIVGWLEIIISFILFGVCFRYWQRNGRDPNKNKTVIAHYDVPEKMLPLEFGAFWSNNILKTKDISAAIVGLAVKGFIKIEEIAKKGIFGSKDTKLILLKQDLSSLSESERKLAESLFDGEAEVLISGLKDKFYKKLPAIKSLVKDKNKDAQFFSQKLVITQSIFILIGIMMLLTSTIFFSWIDFLAGSIVWLACGLAIFFLGVRTNKRTPRGADLYWEAKGFRLYMETAEKYRQQFYEKENIFEKFLPYAMIFRMTKLWAKKMREIYGEEYFNNYAPVWYVGSTANFNLDSFSNQLDSISKSMSTAMSSNPSSSGSGGGGFSGGGGGGGGGGGW